MTFHINKSSVANILSFSEVANIAGVHMKMDISKEKVINIHIQDSRVIHLRTRAEDMFYKIIDDTIMVNNPINTSVIPTLFYPTQNKSLNFSLILELNQQEKFDSCTNICTGREHQTINQIYKKE